MSVDAIKAKAIGLGFDLVGIAPAGRSVYAEYFSQWIADGHAGSMTYLTDRFDERTDPGTYMPGAKSVICLAVNYYAGDSNDPCPGTTSDPASVGKVARYARGQDYHKWLKKKLFDLADWIRDTHPGVRTRSGTDSVPVMEKELAVRAGVGWMGKNTCVISPKIGSWILLGEVLTTMDLPPDEPVTDRCGTCTRCIDACPTDALSPYRLEATKCISYLTIEHRGDLPHHLRPHLAEWLYGCDICQEVCPFNRKPITATAPPLRPRVPAGWDPQRVIDWSIEDYRIATKGTAIKRVKLPVLQRNARALLDNLEIEADKT